MTTDDFLTQFVSVVEALGGMSTVAKITAIVLLLVASMKVSFLSRFWDMLGPFKVWVAPTLGLVAGLLGLGAGDTPITLALVLTYVSAGAGAVFIHEILDSLKGLPGLGPVYVMAINLIEAGLGGSKPPQPAPAPETPA